MAKYLEEKKEVAKKIDKLKPNQFITITSSDDFTKIVDEKDKKNVIALDVLNTHGKDRVLDAEGHVINPSRRDIIRRISFPTEKALIIRESMLSVMTEDGAYTILAYEVKKLPVQEKTDSTQVTQ